MRDQQRRAGILDHQLLALRWVARLDRHIRGAGAQHAQHRDEQIDAPVETDRDKRAFADAAAGELAGQLVRAPVQLPVGEPLARV